MEDDNVKSTRTLGSWSATAVYAVAGGLVGALLPVAAAAFEILVRHDPVTTDGILAAWATDLVMTTPAPVVNKTVPDAEDDDDFWVGDLWQNDRFYVSLSDFNYTRIDTDQFNPFPDDDWGYDAPYYFRVKLTFHPNESNPEE